MDTSGARSSSTLSAFPNGNTNIHGVTKMIAAWAAFATALCSLGVSTLCFIYVVRHATGAAR
jgi:hypothetical protein